jgi:hypothetical protein
MDARSAFYSVCRSLILDVQPYPAEGEIVQDWFQRSRPFRYRRVAPWLRIGFEHPSEHGLYYGVERLRPSSADLREAVLQNRLRAACALAAVAGLRPWLPAELVEPIVRCALVPR